MQTYWIEHLRSITLVMFVGYFVLNPISAFSCSSTIVWSTPLSEFLNPVLAKSEAREIVGLSYPEASITGYVNFLVDGYDPCDSFLDSKSTDMPLVLVLPEKGSIKILQHGVFYEYLSEMCSSKIFDQNRFGIVELPASDGELTSKLDVEIVPTGDKDIKEFTRRCSIVANGEFEEIGDDLYFKIERIGSLTRYMGKLELEHLHNDDD